MVQLGSFHIGKVDEVSEPTVSITEASYLWDLLGGRYKCLEETGLYYACVHDPDLKEILKLGMSFIEGQTREIEKQMKYYKIPFPVKSVKEYSQENKEILRDEFMFQQVFEGCQCYIDHLARVTRSFVTNDSLRNIVSGFLEKELFLFDKLVKYGKAKGWLQISPLYKPN